MSYMGIDPTLAYFGPLLKPALENPHATIITLFLNAIESMRDDACNLDVGHGARYMPQSAQAAVSNRRGVDAIRILSASQLFADHSNYFAEYMQAFNFEGAAAAAGVSMKINNTIVGPWPCALELQLGHPGAREEFKLLLGSAHTGLETYVEWNRA